MTRRALVATLVLLALLGVGVAVVVSRPDAAQQQREQTLHDAQPVAENELVLIPWGSGLPRAGQWRHGFELVDFDGDGRLDVVHGPARKSATRVPQIFRGDGAGGFVAMTNLTWPPLPLDYGDVAVADFDGDGALDLALASHLLGIAVLVRRGDAFEPYATDVTADLDGFSSRALEAVDLNADGRVDIVASSDGPRPYRANKGGVGATAGLVVLLGSEGGFERMPVRSDAVVFGDSLAIGDVDPAAGLEIVAAANVVGSRHLLYKHDLSQHGEAGLVLSPLPAMPEQRVPRVVALVLSAGAPRVLVGGLAMGKNGLEGSLDVVRPGPSPSATRLFAGEPLVAVTALGVGDLNADGAPDVVAGEQNGTLRLFLGKTDGFVPQGTLAPEPHLKGCTVYGIVLAALDGQPGDEVVASYAGDDGSCPSAGGIQLYRTRTR